MAEREARQTRESRRRAVRRWSMSLEYVFPTGASVTKKFDLCWCLVSVSRSGIPALIPPLSHAFAILICSGVAPRSAAQAFKQSAVCPNSASSPVWCVSLVPNVLSPPRSDAFISHPVVMSHLPNTPSNMNDAEEDRLRMDAEGASLASRGPFYRFAVNSWTQIVLVSVACFCLPGMYNAISGMGGSGQLDPTVSKILRKPSLGRDSEHF